jgi:hypothetical protein
MVQTYPHLTPPKDLVVHEVQASPPQVATNDVAVGVRRRFRWSQRLMSNV